MRASPDSLIRTRWKTGSSNLCADGEPREAAGDDVLARRAGEVRAHLLDRLAAVLVGVDVGLVEQHDVVHPRLELALGDLRADVLRLVGRLLLEDAQLGVLGLLRDLVLGDVQDARRGGDVHRDLAGEGLEVLVAGHEVGVAVDLDQHADLAVGVDVGGDGALGGLAAAHLQGLVTELDAQQLDGGVDVAGRLAECVLALHHARARAVAELLALLGGNRGSGHFSSFSSSLESSPPPSATAPAAPATTPATPFSGPGARFATASAAPSTVSAAVSATVWAVSTAVPATVWAVSTAVPATVWAVSTAVPT